jgi:hypothetical protein
MRGFETAGIVLAIPGILDLISRAVIVIKDVRCTLASEQSWY